jgi:hypothetical protein
MRFSSCNFVLRFGVNFVDRVADGSLSIFKRTLGTRYSLGGGFYAFKERGGEVGNSCLQSSVVGCCVAALDEPQRGGFHEQCGRALDASRRG